MQIIFAIGLVLAAIFSFALALYVAECKLHVHGMTKVATVTVSGGVLFVAAVALAIMAVWPPFWPL